MICNVNVYIDENSICKVDTKSDFFEVILELLKLSSAFKVDIEGVTIRFFLWKCDELEGKMLCIDEKEISFLLAVNQILRTDTKRLFKKVFYDKFSKVWNDEQVHCEDTWYEMSNGECVTGDTFAECAELTLSSDKHPIAFVNNKVTAGTLAEVVKGWEGGARQSIYVELADIEVNPKLWLEQKYNVADYCYDLASDIPPIDSQTYLRDSSRYTKTGMINHGKAVHYCVLERTYHVIDNLHYGESSHIEVWNRFGKHLGENDLNGNRISDADSTKNNPSWLS
ncbi:hypothetical protein [Photobacterium sanguinicancri]|uniref:hypothetical protein n=1 Tax=Photobacterium sanguinicancri TaxID=875932 RepID=UPI0021C3E8BA|nr:hypothetical protein [Photobacterium sanguinicancri]